MAQLSPALSAGLLAGVALLAGCGSGAQTYDQQVFSGCIAASGATMSRLQGVTSTATGDDVSLFSRHLPNAGMANFLDAPDGTTVGEFIYFYEAPGVAEAKSAAAWLESRNEYTVKRYGQFVLATDQRPSTDLEKLIDSCRKRAAT